MAPTPVLSELRARRAIPLPYARQLVDEADVQAVVDVLRSDWLTTGPAVAAFESAFAEAVGAPHAIAVSSGTAALHAAMFAAGVGPGDEVIVPPLTFAATANCVVYQGGTPVFADVDAGTLLLDPACVERAITARTKAIIAVDYAGQPCDFAALRTIARKHDLTLVADACHSFGATDRDRPVGSLADMSVFSFHPVKPIACGEGGMITTGDADLATRLRVFRNHGIAGDHRERARSGQWRYEMRELGYNYRLSDIHCALGLSQLRKAPQRLKRRQAIAARYDHAFSDEATVQPLHHRDGATHAHHLYVVRVSCSRSRITRDALFAGLRQRNILANVHYVPVHLHPFYQQRFGTAAGLCPVAEDAFAQILSLPLFAGMSDGDVDDVIAAVREIVEEGAA